MTLFYDNSGIVALSKEPTKHQKDEHNVGKYHLIHKIVYWSDVLPFAMNLVNPFTKTLSSKTFDGHRNNIGVKCVSSML